MSDISQEVEDWSLSATDERRSRNESRVLELWGFAEDSRSSHSGRWNRHLGPRRTAQRNQPADSSRHRFLSSIPCLCQAAPVSHNTAPAMAKGPTDIVHGSFRARPVWSWNRNELRSQVFSFGLGLVVSRAIRLLSKHRDDTLG